MPTGPRCCRPVDDVAGIGDRAVRPVNGVADGDEQQWSGPAGLIMQDTAATDIYYQWASIVEPLPIVPAWLLADIRNRRRQPKRSLLRTDVHNRSRQRHRPTRAGLSQGHSAALPPTQLFIANGLGWLIGSRDSDCFRLPCRLWSQYGAEATVVGLIFKAWERTPQDHPFTWADAYYKIK
jgi:hypothetical protein